MNPRTPILVVGHGVSATGFSRVLQGLLTQLVKDFEVHHLAPNYVGQAPELPWTLHANPSPIDRSGVSHLTNLVERIRPEFVLVLQDLWALPTYLKALRPYRKNLGVIAYCPVDNRILNAKSLAWLPRVNKLVLYTRFAERAVASCLDELRLEDPDFPQVDLAVIPHGNCTDLFYPLPDRDIETPAPQRRAAARHLLFPDRTFPEDSFVVLNASRNQPRKRIDITLEGFARFVRDKPERVYLYLHMGMREIGWDVFGLAHRLGIQDRLLVTTRSRDHPSVSVERLNLIYNACDVGVNTTCGEGWGLASFEHAATGAAQIVPRHSSCAELWADSAVMLEPVAAGRMGLNLEASIVSPEDLADCARAALHGPR